MKNSMNPIDGKVNNVKEVLSTSKTIMNLLNVIGILGMLTGLFFAILFTKEFLESPNDWDLSSLLFPFCLIVIPILIGTMLRKYATKKK